MIHKGRIQNRRSPIIFTTLITLLCLFGMSQCKMMEQAFGHMMSCCLGKNQKTPLTMPLTKTEWKI